MINKDMEPQDICHVPHELLKIEVKRDIQAR